MKQKLALIILAYFRLLAKWQLKKNNPLIIGVTGTTGKTSTHLAIQAVLKDKFKLKASYKANSESGLPLDILGLWPKTYSKFEWLKLMLLAPIKLITNWEKYDIYLAEMAIDSPNPPKNMAYLLTIIKPQIGVFLNVGLVHSFTFDHLCKQKSLQSRAQQIKQLIANEKGLLITQLPKNGLAVLNANDPLVADFSKKTKAKVIFFGNNQQADVQVVNSQQSLLGSQFTFQYQGKKTTINKKGYLLENTFANTFASAIAVGLHLGLTLKECCLAIEKNYQLAPGRSSLIEGVNHSLIFDSSYNASADTTQTLPMLNKLGAKRLLVLLGDLRELGQQTQLEHQRLANYLVQSPLAEIVLVGPEMKKYALPILNNKARWFRNAYLASQYLKNQLQAGDLLLVRGSQNTILLEIAVEQLMAKPHLAEQLLCRRGEFWEKRRFMVNNNP